MVDDTPIVREPIAAALRLEGWDALCAADGVEALAAARQKRPDVILLDLVMPRMDGIAFLRALRGDPHLSNVPVILLTAVADRQRVVEAARLGVRDYLLKSQFSLKQMIARVKQCMEAPRELVGQSVAAAAAVGASTASGPADSSGGTAVAVAPPPPRAAPPSPSTDAVDSPPPDALKKLKPLVTRSQMTELVDACGELKAMSPTVMQIVKLTSSPTCSMEQVVETIKMDQAIALKVLKLANSVVYTRGDPVENVHKAVMRIGLAQIRQTALNIAVMDQFSASQDAHLNAMAFWEHAIACGLIASQIAKAAGLGETEVDSAFTMGLLHDVGRLVYLERLGPVYEQVLATARELQLPLEQVESRLLLVNHADAMDRILHGWRFPKNLINPIALHHLSMGNIRQMAKSSVQEVATLALADRLAHALLLGDSGNATIYPTHEYCQALRIEATTIADISAVVPGQTQDIKLAMLSRGGGSSVQPLDVRMRAQLARPLKPLFVSASPAIDAYRLAVERLSAAADPMADPIEGPPTVAIVHLGGARDMPAATSQLQQAEEDAGGGRLPTIVISPSGDLGLAEPAASKRPIIRLHSPTPVARLVEAINSIG